MDEETSIGYAANYAAKLQGLSRPAYISISSNIYESLDDDYKRVFEIISSAKIKKYDQEYYASTLINKLRRRIDVTKELEYARSYANRLNLTAINFSEARQAVDFSNLSKKNCKKLYGIPLFSDVRGFTEQFEEDDSNLEQMAIKTQNILTAMYTTVIVLIISSMLCLITFFPNLGKNVVIDEEKSNSKKLNLVFFGDISKMSSVEEYIDNVVNNYYPGDDDFKNDILIRDLAEEIVVNSQITVKKYSLFRKAVLADIVAFIFAITTFVAA